MDVFGTQFDGETLGNWPSSGSEGGKGTMVIPCASSLPTGVLSGRWLAPSPAASPLGLVDLPSPGVAFRASEWLRLSATSPF